MLQGVLSPFVEIVHAIQSMPKIMDAGSGFIYSSGMPCFCYWQPAPKQLQKMHIAGIVHKIRTG